jgi:hypothetical protein
MAATPNGLLFIPSHALNLSQWEACLAQSPEDLLYAQAWYLDVVCARWSAVVEVQDGCYVSVLPLPEKHTAGLRQVYQPFFTQQLGLFTTPASRHTRVEAYLALIPGSYWRVSLQLNTRNRLDPGTAGPEFKLKQRTTYHLALDRPYETIWQGYSQNQKRNIRKGADCCRVVPGDMDRLLALFRENKGPQVPELGEKDYARLARLYQEIDRRHCGQVLELWAAAELLAAGLFLCSGRYVVYLFGASTAAGRRQAAMARLLDWVIRQQAGSGRILDFEGSDIPGLAKFYAGFGARPVPYVSLRRHSIPFLPSWLNKKFLS